MLTRLTRNNGLTATDDPLTLHIGLGISLDAALHGGLAERLRELDQLTKQART